MFTFNFLFSWYVVVYIFLLRVSCCLKHFVLHWFGIPLTFIILSLLRSVDVPFHLHSFFTSVDFLLELYVQCVPLVFFSTGNNWGRGVGKEGDVMVLGSPGHNQDFIQTARRRCFQSRLGAGKRKRETPCNYMSQKSLKLNLLFSFSDSV